MTYFFTYHDMDATLYFGYFTSASAFLKACWDESPYQDSRGHKTWIKERITVDEKMERRFKRYAKEPKKLYTRMLYE